MLPGISGIERIKALSSKENKGQYLICRPQQIQLLQLYNRRQNKVTTAEWKSRLIVTQSENRFMPTRHFSRQGFFKF